MYNLGPKLNGQTVDAGTNLLITGPPLSGKRQLALDILKQGFEDDEGGIIISTKDSSDRILTEYEAMGEPLHNAPLGIVDCVTKYQGTEPSTDTATRKFASSPHDMTGIGIKLSEILEHFYTNQGIRHNRVMLHSLSTLVIYSNIQTVFRFLHVFTGRTQSANALGIFIIESTAHDQKTMHIMTQLFDGVIETNQETPRITFRTSMA